MQNEIARLSRNLSDLSFLSYLIPFQSYDGLKWLEPSVLLRLLAYLFAPIVSASKALGKILGLKFWEMTFLKVVDVLAIRPLRT